MKKLSLASVEGTLSRLEMKMIMAGSWGKSCSSTCFNSSYTELGSIDLTYCTDALCECKSKYPSAAYANCGC